MFACLRTSTLITLSAFLVACSSSATDSPRSDSKDSLWQAECESLPDGIHTACYGPGWQANHTHDPNHYDFYEVSVEKPKASGGSTVVSDRRLAAAQVAPRLLKPGKVDVVRFDESRREVTFLVAPERIVFLLND